ncbi:MAG TPA: bifunctional serine/threonine-protein kinase/formylglycine-generating enzyme family protein, partial [Thermoanaerobaculia bacterium]
MTSSMTGRRLSHYEIFEKIGQGGMGVVYRARDTRLERFVALKVLRPEAVEDPERIRRFVREAKAASALNHPAIVVIYDIGNADGVDFIAMELIDGEPLDAMLGSGGLPLERVVSIAADVASALGAAHKAGIVHRDVKPGNVMVAEDDRVKVLDFGLAKLVEREGAAPTVDSLSPTATSGDPRTQQGVVLGTLAYLSPEQAEGKPVDARSDVFSFGTMLYEMLAGRRPFQGASTIGTITAILRDVPQPIRSLRPDVPEALARVLERCLEKKPENRYPSAAEVSRELATIRAAAAGEAARPASSWRRPAVVAPVMLLALAAIGFGVVSMRRTARERAARQGLAEIPRRMEQQDFTAVFRLLEEARRVLPADPEFQRALASYSEPMRIETEPAGAAISFASYLKPELGWQLVGSSPISASIPFGSIRLRAEKEGLETFEGAPVGDPVEGGGTRIALRLEPKGGAPEGMVRVPAGRYARRGHEPVELPQYWLDRLEVTNRRYKGFVEGGGYAEPRYWKQPFVKEGRTLAFAEAMALFRDSTGRPGPASWELSTHPPGREDFPVSGVSWYEAAAYAEFAEKMLPTVYHWYRATEQDVFSEVLKLSNFGGEGPLRAGSLAGLGPYGTYDLAGNVKEWCANAWEEKRYVAGGSWSDPVYLYDTAELADPWSRPSTTGFRCARAIDPAPPELSRAVLLDPKQDLSKLRPVDDDTFKVYAGLYAYERAPL